MIRNGTTSRSLTDSVAHYDAPTTRHLFSRSKKKGRGRSDHLLCGAAHRCQHLHELGATGAGAAGAGARLSSHSAIGTATELELVSPWLLRTSPWHPDAYSRSSLRPTSYSTTDFSSCLCHQGWSGALPFDSGSGLAQVASRRCASAPHSCGQFQNKAQGAPALLGSSRRCGLTSAGEATGGPFPSLLPRAYIMGPAHSAPMQWHRRCPIRG